MEIKYTKPYETTGGSIRGYYADEGVMAFKGVPYAEPPVGENRFRPALRYEHREGVRDCVEFGHSGWQNEMDEASKKIWTEEFLIRNTDYSEDCLTLNIWAPEDGKDLPVVLYFYGGGFVSGGSSCDIYDGSAFAKNGVIYITHNHRDGAFGWLSSKELTAESETKRSGNYTLSDEEMALIWIRDNIAAFGGDPDNITIWGQSSGAGQVNLFSVSEYMRRYFKRTVAMGLNSFPKRNLLRWATPEGADEISRALMQECDDSTRKLRQLEPAVFLKHTENKNPVIDGHYVKDTFRHEITEGVNADMTMMMGMVGRDYVVNPMHFMLKSSVGQGQDALRQIISIFYPDTADDIISEYGADGDDDMTMINNICRDAMLFDLLDFAAARDKTCRGKTYIYFFTHVMPGPDADTYGAFHSCEVPYFTGYLSPLREKYWQAEDRTLELKMNKLLSGYVKSGVPDIDDFVPSDGTNLFLITAKEQRNIKYPSKQLDKWRHLFG